jgi:adenosylcobinamide kinase/adenosylcobinamide-phosphate guanylyltransferase
VLVLGGARSGKSAHAESLLSGERAVDYVDTVHRDPDDAEWAERIARRREHRPEDWTISSTDELPAVLAEGHGAVLLDSVSGWLSTLLDRVGLWSDHPGAKDAIAAAVDDLIGAWASTHRFVVAVSDQVGSGLAPDSPEQRLYRDALGLLNQRLAASADEVWLVVAGIPQRLR